jgi:hypothetical protein
MSREKNLNKFSRKYFQENPEAFYKCYAKPSVLIMRKTGGKKKERTRQDFYIEEKGKRWRRTEFWGGY